MSTAEHTTEAPVDERPRLYRILDYNAKFVESKGYAHVGRPTDKAARKSVIVTCMDTRLIRLLPHALNVHEGDAKLIKNAGAVITHPFGGIMRSVIVALYELNADEVYVIGHHDCGMSKINPAHTLERMVHAGIKPETITTLEYAGINIQRWLHGFDSVHESVVTSVKIIRNHPLVPAHVPVHGLLIDPETGKLDLLVDGHADLAARAAVHLHPTVVAAVDRYTLSMAPSPASSMPVPTGVDSGVPSVAGAYCSCCIPAAGGSTQAADATSDVVACDDCEVCRAVAAAAANAAAVGGAGEDAPVAIVGPSQGGVSSGMNRVPPTTPGGSVSSLSAAERGGPEAVVASASGSQAPSSFTPTNASSSSAATGTGVDGSQTKLPGDGTQAPAVSQAGEPSRTGPEGARLRNKETSLAGDAIFYSLYTAS